MTLKPTFENPFIYWARYSTGTSFDESNDSVLRELASLQAPFVVPDVIIGKCVRDAYEQVSKDFIASGAEWMLHVDTDNVMPKGALHEMFDIGCDVVSLHSSNRNVSFYGQYHEFFSQPDNHKQDAIKNDGSLHNFSPALMICYRSVFDKLEAPYWRAGWRCPVCTAQDSTGEVWFAHQVLAHPEISYCALPIISDHLEIETYVGAPDKGEIEQILHELHCRQCGSGEAFEISQISTKMKTKVKTNGLDYGHGIRRYMASEKLKEKLPTYRRKMWVKKAVSSAVLVPHPPTARAIAVSGDADWKPEHTGGGGTKEDCEKRGMFKDAVVEGHVA